MTLRRIEGFDSLNTGGNPSVLYQSGWSGNLGELTAAAGGAFGYGNYLLFTGFADSYNVYWVPGFNFDDEFYFGARVSITNEISCRFTFQDGSTGTDKISICFEAYGIIRIRYGSYNGTILAETLPGAYDYYTWFFIEIRGKIRDSGGRVTLRKNTVTLFDLVDIDTNPSGDEQWNVLHFYHNNSTQGLAIDDIYICDALGTVNNTFLGNSRVQTLLPNAAGDSTVWSRSNTGIPNWQNATNKAASDTQYVYAPNAGDQDLYNIEALINSPTVFGIQVSGSYRQDDATQRFIQNTIKSGSTVDRGYIWDTDSSFSKKQDIWELNPDTGVGFTGSEVNLLQLGPYVET